MSAKELAEILDNPRAQEVGHRGFEPSNIREESSARGVTMAQSRFAKASAAAANLGCMSWAMRERERERERMDGIECEYERGMKW